jgi:hypothetical protein
MSRWRLPRPELGRNGHDFGDRRAHATPFRGALLLAIIVLAAGAMIMPLSVSAHASIDVGNGKYVMQLGFRDEPTYLGQPNALYLKVGEYASGGTKPVDGLADTLKAEISKDGQTTSPPLIPIGNGEYEARFVPTTLGDYTFHISGTIGGAAVDESVTSGPNTFDSVVPLSSIEFPVASPDPAQVQAAVDEAAATAATARLLGIAGLVVGLLGVIVGGVALARAGKARTTATPREDMPAVSRPASGKLIR